MDNECWEMGKFFLLLAYEGLFSNDLSKSTNLIKSKIPLLRFLLRKLVKICLRRTFYEGRVYCNVIL